MKQSRYNRSEIMNQAWMMFRCKFYHYATFGEALKAAWRYAKEEVARKEQVEARKAELAAATAARMANQVETKRDRFYKNFNRRNNAAYRNVRFGRNDWRVSYGRRYY